MEFLRVKEIKVCCLLETVCISLKVVVSCLFLYIFGPHATLSSFMFAKQGIFVRDCKVRHSMTKPYRITVGNIFYV